MMTNKRNKWVTWIACLVSVGGILYGYDIGVISGALLFIRNTIPMTDAQVGLIVGAVFGGSLLGTLAAGTIGDYYGRRFLIMFASAVFILGVFLALFSMSFWMFFSARILLGFGVGMVAVGVPLYVAEIVPSRDRGKFITFFQLLLTFGIVLAYFVDLGFTPTGNWRAMFSVLLIPAFTLFIGIICLPESPRWLFAQNQPEKARAVLQLTRNSSDEVDEDARVIQASLNVVHGSWRECITPQFIVPCVLAVSIAIFNQLTGINSFLQYAPLILKNAGMSSDMVSMMGSAGIGSLNFIFTIIAVALIDVVGRRPLIITGLVGVLTAEVYLACVSIFFATSPNVGLLSLAGLLGFIVFFAIGPGVVVWLAISELFPTRIRGKGIGVCLFFSSIAATTLSVFFLPLVKAVGMGMTYGMFALFTLGYLVVVWKFLPETKARSLEQIQLDFLDKRKQRIAV